MNKNVKKPTKYQIRKSPDKSQLDIVKESFITVSKEYCAESSICGLKHLVNDDTTLVERIIWIIILIVGLICSVSLVWMTFTKYYSAPLVTTQMPEGVSVSKIIFPAVGICTNNRISKRSVTELVKKLIKEERNKGYTEDEMLSLLFGLGQLYDMQPMDDDVVSPMELHRALGEYNVHELMKNLTPRCEDFLVKCIWNTEIKSCTHLFDFRLTVNGYCCTFNYLRSSDIYFKDKEIDFLTDMYNFGNKSTFNYDQGLFIVLRLNEDDDFYYNIPLRGAQLQFSDAYDFPDAPSGSFAMQIISPSVFMEVMVSASFTEASRDIQHVSLDLRNCRFYDESSYLPFYTYSDCILKCRMFFLLDKCNCTPFNMPKMVNSRTCDMRDVICLRTYFVQSITVRPNIKQIPPELELDLMGGGINCPMCCPTCSKTAYSYDFNNIVIYPDHLNIIPDEDREEWLRAVNYTGTSIVHVKYSREVADCYGQNVIMKWFDLISNIGSTCGFVTGFSFVSVLEFLYFYIVKLLREIYVKKKNQQRKTHTATYMKASASVCNDNVTKYRPIYWNELTQSTRFGNFQNPY